MTDLPTTYTIQYAIITDGVVFFKDESFAKTYSIFEDLAHGQLVQVTTKTIVEK